MLNKLTGFIRKYGMLCPGEQVVCAVSGGADSMALLWAMYLLRDKLNIRLSAAHFNHGLRGEESDRDENFVRQFCQDYGIPFYGGRGFNCFLSPTILTAIMISSKTYTHTSVRISPLLSISNGIASTGNANDRYFSGSNPIKRYMR